MKIEYVDELDNRKTLGDLTPGDRFRFHGHGPMENLQMVVAYHDRDDDDRVTCVDLRTGIVRRMPASTPAHVEVVETGLKADELRPGDVFTSGHGDVLVATGDRGNLAHKSVNLENGAYFLVDRNVKVTLLDAKLIVARPSGAE